MVRFWEGKRVFVTGDSGFKGTWLRLWLETMGAKVSGLSLENGDVRDGGLVKSRITEFSPEIVFHLAAQALVGDSYANPLATFSINVFGTVNVLEAAKDSTVVVVTSDKCYRNSGGRLAETDALGGDDPYSASKACSELMAESYRKSFGMRIATARAGNVIGGGDWAENRIVPDLARAAIKGEPARVRNPDSIRPFQHVLDCLYGYLLLAEKLHGDVSFTGAWNFGPDESRSVGWLADKFVKNWNGASWASNSSEVFKENPCLELDSTKARTRLGWKPRFTTEQAVEKTVAWYKNKEDRMDQITSYLA